MFRRSSDEMRVAILAPVGRDARLLSGTLEALQVSAVIVDDAKALLAIVTEGVGAVIIAEEALTQPTTELLTTWLEMQPPWSDLPFIILTSAGRPTRQSYLRAKAAESLGNYTMVERPMRPETAQSTVRSALRARMRQYEIRGRQEALLKANADLEQFAHSASHDLREPLRSIGIYSELLGKHYGATLDERGNGFLNLLQSGAKRMDDLLSDLLSYAHMSGISDELLRPIESRKALDSALENLSVAIQESEAQISVGPLPVVKMHESHLSQLFQNLVGNAIKYRKDNEQLQIRLSASSLDHNWLFSVADNGIGVPPAYRETIFGIFKRLHTNEKYAGTGMGLAICQRIVERYRGRIWVESQPGQGSNFFFAIPD